MTILYVDMKDKISADALATIAQEDVGLFDIDHPYHGSLTDITLAAHTSDDATRIGTAAQRDKPEVFWVNHRILKKRNLKKHSLKSHS